MKRTSVNRSISSLALATALTAIPAGGVWAATHAAAPAAATVHKYKGAVVQMHQWGPIQVTISVKSKKITKVDVSATAHTGRSHVLQSNAIPLLKSETLMAQSATINAVSGATDTSDAYTQSLQSAIDKARSARALK